MSNPNLREAGSSALVIHEQTGESKIDNIRFSDTGNDNHGTIWADSQK